MKIVVTGATGTLGRQVMEAAQTAGHSTVGISRTSGVDLITGTGLEAALTGSSVVIDASATSSTKTKESVDFFSTVTRNLLSAERAYGVPHHVAISIIGAAKVNANYYAGKAAQEEILMAEPTSRWSMLRTTQFHEFVYQLLPAGRVGPFQMVPKMRSQPIAVAEVAAELVRIAGAEPQGLMPDLAGPREERWADLIRFYLAGEQHRPVIEIAMPGAWGRGMRDGTLLPQPGSRLGKQTFDQWLAMQAK